MKRKGNDKQMPGIWKLARMGEAGEVEEVHGDRPAMAAICIRISADDLRMLKAKARALRIPYTTLARSLITQGCEE